MAADGSDELAARDRAILDALYRDDDGRAGTSLDGAQQATLRDWQTVRGVVQHAREHGFDVEAPAAGTRGSLETLMAAARAQAPAPKRGSWARLMAWMTPVIAHPALAGAAALVLVGGAAGVMYVRGKHEVARPEAATQAADPSPRDPSPTSAGESPEVPREPGALGRAGAPGDGVDGDGAAVPAATRPTRVAPEGARPRRGSGAAIGPVVGGQLDSPPTETPPLEARVDELDAEAGRGGAAPRGGPAPTVPAAPSPVTSTPPPAPPAQPRAPAVQIATDDAPARPASPPSGPPRAEASLLTAQARAAAKAGDCAKVAERSRQVLALDPAYHRDVFVRDPDIARCR